MKFMKTSLAIPIVLFLATAAFAMRPQTATSGTIPSSCPGLTNGVDCIGLVGVGTPIVGGTRYTCSNGHTWIVKN